MSQATEAATHFYLALTLAALCDSARSEQQPELARRLVGELQRLKVWAENCPENFFNRYALVSAEVARIERRAADAAEWYERAVRSARENGFVQHEALAYEFASRFYRARGFELIGDTYLREAWTCYRRWGAEGKAKQLEHHYPQLNEPHAFAATLTFATRTEQLDLLSLFKASQAVSSEIVLDQLVRALVKTAVEQSGAREGFLVLVDDGSIVIAAIARQEGGNLVTEIAPSVPGAAASLAPASVLQYVRMTKERVIVDDATIEPRRFAADEYLLRANPRSFLCLPILKQANVLALLYLENDLIAGAFTPHRLAALELLASQAAISMENAWLLARERDARAAAERAAEKEQAARAAAEEAERRAKFLADASAILSTSLAYEQTIPRLARSCVGVLADWCVIDVLEQEQAQEDGRRQKGMVQRRAAVHIEPAREPLFQELESRYPLDWEVAQRSPEVLRTRGAVHSPHLLADLSEQALRELSPDGTYEAIIRALGTRSTMVLPLVAGSHVVGSLTLASGLPGRYGSNDLELARQVAERIAMAIDNARLYRTAQTAVRLRDEFLSTASHELRTPVTTIQLVIQSLTRGLHEGKPSISTDKLAVASRQTERLATLINQLLDVARIESGRFELRLEDFDLVADAARIVFRLQLEIERAKSPICLHSQGAVLGRWDRSRIDQLLTNLLMNALSYGAGQPIDLTIERTPSGHRSRIIVLDRGIGIPKDRLSHIFERFERATSVRHRGGLGLGLYIARQIVEAHGGSISVESEPGCGSSFTVDLPSEPPKGRAC